MNRRVKRLALFISFSAACLGSSYSAIAADPAATENQQSQTERARPPLDFTPPVVTLNGDAVMSLYQGTTYLDPGATAIDAVDGPIRVTVRGSPIMSRPGTYTVTYSAVDRRGNKGTAKRTVHVIADTLAPVITLNGLSTMSIIQGSIFEDLGATATDNLDGEVTVRVVGRVRRNIPGIYTLYYVARDEAGNEARVARTVTVIADTVPPQLTLNGSDTITITKGTAFTDPGAQATDNSDAPVNIRKYGRVNTDRLGTYLVRYQARDGAGNLSTILTRTVIVVASTPTDTTAPVITLNGSTSIELTVGDTYNEPGATATDNVDPSVTVTISGSVDTTTAGNYTITYTAQDNAGNTSTLTRIVVVKPRANVAPTANAGADQIANELTAVTLSGTGADTDGTISYAWTQVSGPTVTLSPIDQAQANFTAPDVTADTELTFKLTVTDDDGATAEDTVSVTVKAVDNTKPVITLLGDTHVELTVGDAYVDAGATATDNVDSTVTVTATGSVNTSLAGTYTITYTAQDSAGNQANPVTRTIMVKAANVAPTANAGADQEANELIAVTLTGSGTDTDGTIATYAWTQIGEPTVSLANADSAQASFSAPDVAEATNLTFKLTVTDDKGAIAEDTVVITVQPATSADTVPPVITLNGLDKIYHQFDPEYPNDNPYEDQGATAMDNVDGEVTVVKSGDNPAGFGTYTITYTASDSIPNTATKNRIVKVLDINPLYARAGSEQTTMELETVSLDGSNSYADSEHGYEISSYEWKQIKGTTVTLSNNNSATTNFIAPDISLTETLEFMLIVTDNYGFKSSAITTVKVMPLLSPTPQTTGKLNDTGVTGCGDNSTSQLPCPVTTHPNQDAQNGRDFTAQDHLDGYAGFSFTKLDSNGIPLADQMTDYSTTPWSCVKDNVTGLIWEVKTNDNGLNDAKWTYGVNYTGQDSQCSLGDLECTAVNYIQAVNQQGLCNANDWRLPTLDELFGLVAFDKSSLLPGNINSIPIDTNYFPNIISSSTEAADYWTSDIPFIHSQRYYHFFVSFKHGSINFNYDSLPAGFLLVRGKK